MSGANRAVRSLRPEPADDEVTRLMPAPSASSMPRPPDSMSARQPVSFPRGRAVLEDGPTRHMHTTGSNRAMTGERPAFPMNHSAEAYALRSAELSPLRSNELAAFRAGEMPAFGMRTGSGERAAVRSGELAAFSITSDRRVPPAPVSVPLTMSVTSSDSRASSAPGTVITTRTRALSSRPAISWAAALVAMGVFTGLVTAVLARGESDSMADVTASFVDPAHAPGAESDSVLGSQPMADPGPPSPVLGPVEPIVVAPEPEMEVREEQPVVVKEARKVEHVAAAPKPAARPVAHARVTHAKPERAEKIEKVEHVAKAEKAETSGSSKEKEKQLAEAAKRLADAQLEQSL